MHDLSTKSLAIKLREEGYSYPYISEQTGLSKSTLSGWLTDIPYTPNEETVRILGKARAAAGERKAEIKRSENKLIREAASAKIGKLNERDLFMLGLGLYLSEGAKTSNIVRIVNSDPKVIQTAIAWFLSLGVSLDQFSPRIHLYPDNDMEGSLEFWSGITKIPTAQFHKSYVDIRTDKKQNKVGRLPHGTLHLRVKSMGKKKYGVLFFRTIQMWSEAAFNDLTRD